MILTFLVLLHSQPLSGERESNTLVNFSNIVANGNDLSDCWICHRQPGNPPPPPQLQSTCFNLSLAFLSGVPNEFPKSSLLFVKLDHSGTNLGCIHLTQLFERGSKSITAFPPSALVTFAYLGIKVTSICPVLLLLHEL